MHCGRCRCVSMNSVVPESGLMGQDEEPTLTSEAFCGSESYGAKMKC